MGPTERAIAELPPHLRRFVVAQDHAAYTPRDHAVWRHVLRRLTAHLATRAHPRYLAGLAATGIEVERIPSLDEMNRKLARVGWSAVAVRGFIPPAVFTELQSRRVLAIAADIRTHEHIEYTPAPDIIHESAGHAPFIADPTYAEYLRRAGEVGFRAIASAEDQAVFEAIRNLSVVKEDPEASEEEVALSEARLRAASASVRYASESTRASRLYWWTAEYGLVGTLDDPRIYGAGLLSSIGEAVHCLTPAVRKLPLDPGCADVAYDITRMQPQLFVARDFDQLFEVLDAFDAGLSWRRGGDRGLEEARRARTVNHLALSGGRELTGKVAERIPAATEIAPGLSTALVRLDGPVLVSRDGRAEGKPWPGEVVVAFGDAAVPERGPFDLALPGGLALRGFAVGGGEVVDLRATRDGRPLELPTWALLFVSRDLRSVAGGPADPGAWDRWFGEHGTFTAGEGEARARARKAKALPPALAALYDEVRRLRETGRATRERLLAIREAAAAFPGDWLLRAEVDELLAPGAEAGAHP
ncbi:aromatic amino acid hydroxylase [Anaeromyxobacter dehalogenans]|uniref:Phenylalanine 4-hydroxylase n=1 Tax=Anaeromyxobacter dehalogenans (strain 2CP-C) TaxID=290397 RepID=Q2ILP1_ANADE|nr:aromatic amino acid hydroxylase [Anaeromyxobacter dehalogenans]ABC82570.1 Phenylalanine 4-hydroxylase [Anaeromyxobacter dehalogenans 2CP-C]